MRFDRLVIAGFGAIDRAAIDFAAIGGPLVAVVGPNGAGKSTLLELLAGAVYRTTPTRGSLGDLATRRDATLEAVVMAGAPFTVRHAVDGQTGKAEATAIDGAGRPITASGKVRDYDAWVRDHLPPAEVLFASMFVAQADGGFLAMKAGDRKAVLLRALGIERLEALAESARGRARVARGEASAHEEVAMRTAGADDERGAALGRLEMLRGMGPEIEGRMAAARVAAASARDAAAEWRARAEARAEADRRAAEGAAALADAERRRDDAATRLENNRRLLARADEVRAAEARADDLRTQREGVAAKIASLRADADRCAAAAAAAERAQREAEGRAAAARGRADRIRRQLDGLGDPADLREAVAFAEGVAADRARELAEAEAALEAIRGERLMDAAGRIVRMRFALGAVVSAPAADARDIATRALADDDAAEAAARSAPERHGRAEGAVVSIRRAVAAAGQALAAAQRAAAAHEGRGALVEAQLAEDAAAAAAAADAERAAHDARTQRRQEGGAREAMDAAAAAAAQLDRDLADLAEPLGLAPRLASAAARIAELELTLTDLAGRIAGLAADRDAHAATPPPGPAPDPAPADRELAAAEDATRRYDRDVVAAIERLTAADAAVAARGVALARLAEARESLEDWTLLADDLGRDGLQALEIDGAGPELTAIVNDLLAECYGPRFTVTIEATRPSADGKRTLEGCEVRVLDTVGGREGAGETFSGGERVILGEAIAMALATLACRRHGLEGVTLVRDETGAALDEAAGRAYVAMLRRGAAAMGASRVLFVSHNPDLQALADARIVVAGGTVRIEEAP